MDEIRAREIVDLVTTGAIGVDATPSHWPAGWTLRIRVLVDHWVSLMWMYITPPAGSSARELCAPYCVDLEEGFERFSYDEDAFPKDQFRFELDPPIANQIARVEKACQPKTYRKALRILKKFAKEK